jgi:hypothetical protein
MYLPGSPDHVTGYYICILCNLTRTFMENVYDKSANYSFNWQKIDLALILKKIFWAIFNSNCTSALICFLFFQIITTAITVGNKCRSYRFGPVATYAKECLNSYCTLCFSFFICLSYFHMLITKMKKVESNFYASISKRYSSLIFHFR